MANEETKEIAKKALTTNQKIMIAGFSVLTIALVTITVAGIVIGDREEVKPSIPQLVTSDNFEQIKTESKEKTEAGYFETWMNVLWNFPDGESPSSSALMGNSPSNQYPFYFEVYITDTSELVYTSDLLPVGTSIKEIILDVDLPKGTYEAYANIKMVNEDELVENNMSISLTLVIAN